MLASFYHRAQLPGVYQRENNKLTLEFRIEKHCLENAVILFVSEVPSNHRDYNLIQEFVMDKVGETTLYEQGSGTINFKSSHYRYLFKITTFEQKTYYFGAQGICLNPNISSFGFAYAWQETDLHHTLDGFHYINFYQIVNDEVQNTSQLSSTRKQKTQDISPILKNIHQIGYTGINLKIFFSPSTQPKSIKIPQITDNGIYHQTLPQVIKLCKKLKLKIIFQLNFKNLDFTYDTTYPCVLDGCKKYVKIGVDGLVIDVDSSTSLLSFWQDFKSSLLDINSQMVLIAKTHGDAINYLQSHQFYGVTSYNLYHIIIQYVLSNRELKDKLNFIEMYNQYNLQYTPEQKGKMLNVFFQNETVSLGDKLNYDGESFTLAGKIMFYNSGATLHDYPQNFKLSHLKSSFVKSSFYHFFQQLILNKLKLMTQINIYDRTYAKLDDQNRILLVNPNYFLVITESDCQLELGNLNNEISNSEEQILFDHED